MALSAIRNVKNIDGSFGAYTRTEHGATHETTGNSQAVYKATIGVSQTIFITLLTARFLAEAKDNLKYTDQKSYRELCNILEPTCSFIRDQVSNTSHTSSDSNKGSWNYWGNDNQNNAKYPDDLDDTCNALYVLYSCNKNYIDSEILYNFTNHLLSAKVIQNTQNLLNEQTKSTAYHTWIYDTAHNIEQRPDIDPVVQVILYKFLSQIKSIPPSFETYMRNRIASITDIAGITDVACATGLSDDSSMWTSKYYHRYLYVLCELSSVGQIAAEASSCSTSSPLSDSKNILDQILLAQIQLNAALDRPSKAPLNVRSNSSLRSMYTMCKILLIPLRKIKYEDLYIESGNKKQTVYCGSRSVTLALYIKLFSCFIQKHENVFNIKTDIRLSPTWQKIYENCTTVTHKTLSVFGNAKHILDIVFKSDDHIRHIVDEMFRWHNSFKGVAHSSENEVRRKNTDVAYVDAFTKKICLMTSYGWVAYTIYDALIDKEVDISYLPIATTCHGHLFSLFSELVPQRLSEIHKEILKEIFFENDRAEYAEATQTGTHFVTDTETDTDFVPGAKSIGCCIGPLLIFLRYFPKVSTEHIRAFIDFYRCLLSARQLSDDAHDWEIDIQQKKQTHVTVMFEKYSTRNTTRAGDATHAASEKLEDKNLIELRKIFTEHILHDIKTEMQKYIEQATHHISKLQCIYMKPEAVAYWLDQVRKYADGIDRAIVECEVMEKFSQEKEERDTFVII